MSKTKIFRYPSLPYLVLVLAFPAPAFAHGPKPAASATPAAADNLSPEQTLEQFEKILDFVPDGARLKCAAKDFTDIVQPAQYSDKNAVMFSNAGLDGYISGLVSTAPPLAEEAKQFYLAAMAQVDAQGGTRAPGGTYIHEFPLITESAGDSHHSELKPGWLWDLALKTTHGDADEAMRVIGICGNDDVQQNLAIPVTYTPDEAQRLLAMRQRLYARAVSGLQAALASSEPSSMDTDIYCQEQVAPLTLGLVTWCRDKAYLPGLLEQVSEQMASLQATTSEYLSCPLGYGYYSDFFLPASLGKGVDISKAAKERVEHVESQPAAGMPPGSDLPAKYYHVYGSAFVACEMIARGHDPALVTALSALSAWYYRVLTLTSQVGLLEQYVPSVSPSSSPLPFNPTFAQAFGPGYEAQRDAVELLRRRTLSGDFGKSIGVLYTDLPDAYLKPFTEEKPEGWSDARYEKAKAQYKIFMDGFKWTIEQHVVGARFAAKYCKVAPQYKDKKPCSQPAGSPSASPSSSPSDTPSGAPTP